MTTKYFVNSKKRLNAPVYIRLSAGRGTDLIVKSGQLVNPKRWSNKTQTIKQRILTESDKEVIKELKGLKEYVESEFKAFHGDITKDWLNKTIDKFYNPKDSNDDTLNGYIETFISESEAGDRKGRGGDNLAEGTIKGWKSFKRLFFEYQGIYTEKRIAELTKKKEALNPKRIIDFEDITMSFFNEFTAYLSDKGYTVNSIGRYVKTLKIVLTKALTEKKHNNREFKSFPVFTEDIYTTYLTEDEVELIYKHDLSKYPRMELARDAFIVLCETAVRISDYPKIEFNIRKVGGKELIFITQQKTTQPVVIPLSRRLKAILKKYNGTLPRIPEQYVNKYIKTVALWCGITQELRWTGRKYGKKFEKKASKYELLTCHSGRRTACTLMYLSGIPVIDIMKISGHRTEKEFMKYIRITPEETALRLSDHPYFSGLKVAH